MNKKIITILVLCAIKLSHAQQLSPIQMQKLKADFDAAVKAKKFDAAQTYLNQIEQGGRRAEAQKLMVDLAQARQKEAESKKLEELHKGHKAEAARVMATREAEKYKKEVEELRKQIKDYKALQQPKSGQPQYILKPKDDRPEVPITVYQKITGKSDYVAPHEILKVQSSATQDEIRKAWQDQIRIWNPDRNKDPQARDAYMLINWAYVTLSK